MTRPAWKEVRRLLESALEHPVEEQDGWVKAQTTSPELRAEVLELLQHVQATPDAFAATPPELEFSKTHDPLPARLRIEGFDVGDMIGRGAMGTVYRAAQPSMQRDVAIKFLSGGEDDSEERRQRFRREIRSAGRLDSKSIARVYVDGEVQGIPWFAMELVEGHSLAHEIGFQKRHDKGNRLLPAHGTEGYWAAIATLIAEAAEGVAVAHEHGIIHRDLKPSNLLVSRERKIKVIDFGVAHERSSRTLTATGQLIGSLPYMSPEQACIVRGEVDGRSDVYSLGTVLYELITLRKAHSGTSTAELLQAIEFDDPAPIETFCQSCPEPLQMICEKAMEKHASHRFQGAEDLAGECWRFLAGETLSIKRAPASRRWIRRLKQHRTVLLLVTLGLAAVAFGWRIAQDFYEGRLKATVAFEGSEAGEVSVRYLDMTSGIPMPPQRLGAASKGPFRVEPGFAHVLFRPAIPSTGAQPVLEFSRQLRAGEVTTIQTAASEGALDPNAAAMVRFEGGVLRAPARPEKEQYDSLSPLRFRDVVVEPFALDVTEVSIGAYREFVQAKSGVDWPEDTDFLEGTQEFDELPMVFVTWHQAVAYAEWRGKRLPTRAEWLFAGTDGGKRRYPWGDDPTPRGNVHGARSEMNSAPMWASGRLAMKYLAPVVSHPEARTPEGIYHMWGNVSEWVDGPSITVLKGESVVAPDGRLQCGETWIANALGRDLFDAYDLVGADLGSRSPACGFRCASSLGP